MPARLVVRLAPLGGRVDLVQDAAQVEVDGGVAVAGLGGGHARAARPRRRPPAGEPSPLTANQSRWPTSSVLRALAMLKCSRVGRPEVSAGLAKVSPSAPGDRPAQPDQAAAADRVQRRVLRRGDGERRDPARQALRPPTVHRRRRARRPRPTPGRGRRAAGRPSGDSANGRRASPRTAVRGRGGSPAGRTGRRCARRTPGRSRARTGTPDSGRRW